MGNALVDSATKDPHIFNSIEAAKTFHEKFHVNASTLKLKFKLTKAVARNIVKSCERCVSLLSQPSLGVNPKGLLPKHIWQMDVTHMPEFRLLKYVHVSIDTFSGFIMASLHSGEKAKDVIAHCLHSFSVLGIPKQLKTDNGPGYTSTTFKQFCATFGITHVTGIPYNPQGQSIVERAHLTIKNTLFKQKGGIGDTFRSPRDKLSTILYILNFLNVDKNQHTAAERHWCTLGNSQPKVLWRDLLSGQWKGPDQAEALFVSFQRTLHPLFGSLNG